MGINKPSAINVDELNKIFVINENHTMTHGRCSNLVFERRMNYIVPDMYKANIADFNALISPVMVDLVHAAATIQICYQHKPIIYASIAHELLDGISVIYGSDQEAELKINHLHLTRLMQQYPINTKDLLNHLHHSMNKPMLHPLHDYMFKVQIVLEYDQTMIESYVSFNVGLFDKDKTRNQIEHALNDSYEKYNAHIGDLNGIVVNIIIGSAGAFEV